MPSFPVLLTRLRDLPGRAARMARRRVRLSSSAFRLLNGRKANYDCPICGYRGPFRDVIGRWTAKRDTECARCGSTERTRMLWVVLDQALGALEGRPERAIHFAPEALLRPLLE